MGGALTLIERLLSTGTGEGGGRLLASEQVTQAGEQAGAKLFEQTDDVLFEFGQAMRSLIRVTNCSGVAICVIGFKRTSYGRARYGVLADTIVAQPQEVHLS